MRPGAGEMITGPCLLTEHVVLSSASTQAKQPKKKMPIYDPDRYPTPDCSSNNFPRYSPPPPEEPACDASSQLDSEPKTSEKPPSYAKNRGYIFHKHKNACERLEAWMAERCTDENLKNRVLSCGGDAWIDQSPSTGRFRVRCQRCGYRACPLCRIRWSLKVRDKMESVVADVKPNKRKLCTLTLRNSSAPLAGQVQRLWKAFQRLRQRTIWKRAVRGCIAVLEVTYNAEKDTWHPHLHCVLDADYLDSRKLSKQWLQITLNSKIVDVRAVLSLTGMVKYLTKYLLKSVELPVGVDQSREDEFYLLFRRLKSVRFMGSLRPRKGEEIWKPPYPEDWEPFRPLHVLLEQVANGDPYAQRVLDLATAERALLPDDVPLADTA